MDPLKNFGWDLEDVLDLGNKDYMDMLHTITKEIHYFTLEN